MLKNVSFFVRSFLQPVSRSSSTVCCCNLPTLARESFGRLWRSCLPVQLSSASNVSQLCNFIKFYNFLAAFPGISLLRFFLSFSVDCVSSRPPQLRWGGRRISTKWSWWAFFMPWRLGRKKSWTIDFSDMVSCISVQKSLFNWNKKKQLFDISNNNLSMYFWFVCNLVITFFSITEAIVNH